MKLILALLIAVTCIDFCMSNSDLPEMDFKSHYDNLSQKRYPLYKNGDPWRSGRKYILDKFHEFGIRNITEQSFKSKVSGEKVTGVNIIGIREGANKTGPIIIVGADYDTSMIANQHKDNTGGIASLLEVIHIFCDRIDWNPNFLNHTVIFVAFDLNTKEYRESGMEFPGSHHFINKWLVPYMINVSHPLNKSKLLGAIILDSITTYNMEQGSQTLRDGFEEGFPAAYKEITETDLKGDFLGLLYPRAQKNNTIIKTFSDNFNNNIDKSLPFRLQNMEVTLSMDLLRSDVLDTINHQSHYYFWTHADKPMPAFLLYDTDSDRLDPNTDCKFNCSVTEFLTTDKIQFMEKTTTAVWKTLIDLQTTKSEVVSSGVQIVPAVFILIVSTVCSYGLFK